MTPFEELLAKHGIEEPVCPSGVGDGWLPILDAMFTEMVRLEWDRDLIELREHEGGLRVCIGIAEVRVYGPIDRAQELALITCESCGQPGKWRATNGKAVVVCDACGVGG